MLFRKRYLPLCCLLFTLCFLPTNAHAADVTLTLGDVNYSSGSTILVPLTLTAGGGTVSVIYFDVNFVWNHVVISDVQAGAAAISATKDVYFFNIGASKTRIIIGGYNLNTIPAGVLANIEFTIQGAPSTRGGTRAPFTGASPLSGDNTSAASPLAAPMTVEVLDGSITGTFPGLSASTKWLLTILAGFIMAFAIYTLRRRKALLVVLLSLAVTGNAFAAPAAGDLDNSGGVDQNDLIHLVNASYGFTIAYNADLDLSGKIDAVDFQLLVLIVNSLVTDTDGDGLLDDAEDNIGSDPNLPDSDGDGVDDGDEIIADTNPNVAESSSIIINEFVANNDTGIVDEDGDHVDWLELYNPTDSAINLTGWSMTDDPLFPRKWMFPSGTIMASGEYLILYASGKIPAPTTNIHISFRLNRAGEYLALFNNVTTATTVHEFAPLFPKQKKDTSYGRLGSTAFLRYFDIPTPGAYNAVLGGVFLGFVDDLMLSVPRGFYIAGFSTTITTNTPGVTIKYTTDGTVPTLGNGTTYTGSLAVTGNTALRAVGFLTDFLPSPIETNTYLINVPAEQRSLPTFVMTADPQESLYEPNGVMAIVGGQYVVGTFGLLEWEPVDLINDYNNPMQHGRDYERPLSLEYFGQPLLNNLGFQADAGVRISGSDFHRNHYTRNVVPDWTGPGPFIRMASYDKFSFRYYFRDSYGPRDLNFDLFGFLGSTVTQFDRLVARGGHNDGYNPFIKDELSRRLHSNMGELASHGMLANIFINGEYKAYYNIVERIDEDFLQSHYASINQFDIIGFLNSPPGAWEVKEGTGTEFQSLMTLVNSGVDFSLAGNYQQIVDKLDINSFINYLLVELYTGNDDWPINNWTAGREITPGAKWIFYLWDTEGSFGGSSDTFEATEIFWTGMSHYPFWRPSFGAGLKGENTPIANIYRAAVQNATFRNSFNFLTHAAFDPGGALNPTNVTTRYNELKAKMSGLAPILANNAHTFNTFIEDSWINGNIGLGHPARATTVLADLQAEGLYTP